MNSILTLHRVHRAIEKLGEYAADDSITAEHINPLLKAFDARNLEQFKALALVILPHYSANVYIDMLLENISEFDFEIVAQ